jgi:hypothetical protein
MQRTIKKEWILNHNNIFGLPRDSRLELFNIQNEIQNQVGVKKNIKLLDFLMLEIDINKAFNYSPRITIQSIIKDCKNFEERDAIFSKNEKVPNGIIIEFLKQLLSNEYSNNLHKNILTFTTYQSQYNDLLESFLTLNTDTDKEDFIKIELLLCDNLEIELNKPIYDIINFYSEVLKPCRFKADLTNSLDKRRKFLEGKQAEVTPLFKTSLPQKETKAFEFENNFDHADVKDVYSHFQTELVISKMLTEDELQNFLIAAFQEKTPPKKSFNLKGGKTKEKVMKVFYKYYIDKAGKPYGRQKEYAELLGNYFQGYKTSTVSTNFSK